VTRQALRTLRAVTARLVPGPPEDPDPGASEAGAAEAIARLLDGVDGPEPPIHAASGGGFIPLDPVAKLGWQIRIDGSNGIAEREFAGPVKGFAQRVADGLALIDRLCRESFGVDFADAPATDQDAVLGGGDAELTEFVALALTLTLDAVYGPPEYGGNRDRAGWLPLGWPGFTQPHGFTPEQVSEPDAELSVPEAGPAVSREAVSELSSKLPDDLAWRLQSD
jgi:hypothetical protein